MLDNVLDVFIANNLVSFGTNIEDKKPFYIVSGEAHFIDFKEFSDAIKDFPAFGARFQKLTGAQNFASSLKNPKELSEQIKSSYKESIAMIVLGENVTASCYIEPSHLTSSLRSITDNYGRISQIPITVFGLKVGFGYPEDEVTGQSTFADSRSKTQSHLHGMGESIFASSTALEGINRFFRMRGNLHLFPIAIFVDLVSG